MKTTTPEKRISIVIVMKPGGEKYVFFYRASLIGRARLVRTLSRFAASPSLSLTWRDMASVLRVAWFGRKPF